MIFRLNKHLPVDHDRVLAALARAERGTTGQIRILIARHRVSDPVAAAQGHFERLGMAQTQGRNAVLIYVAPRSRRFAVLGDVRVHEACGEGFWTELAEAMGGYFRKGDFTQGLVHGIERAGALLTERFPRDGQPGIDTSGLVEETD